MGGRPSWRGRLASTGPPSGAAREDEPNMHVIVDDMVHIGQGGHVLRQDPVGRIFAAMVHVDREGPGNICAILAAVLGLTGPRGLPQVTRPE